jgi:hypothetical protein
MELGIHLCCGQLRHLLDMTDRQQHPPVSAVPYCRHAYIVCVICVELDSTQGDMQAAGTTASPPPKITLPAAAK